MGANPWLFKLKKKSESSGEWKELRTLTLNCREKMRKEGSPLPHPTLEEEEGVERDLQVPALWVQVQGACAIRG